MKTVAVCSVSQQTVPVILFCKEMMALRDIQHIYLLVSNDMQPQVTRILQASEEIARIHTIITLDNPYQIQPIISTLDKVFNASQFNDVTFLVDLTCGTKIMSIAQYKFFTDLSSELYYQSRGNAYRKLHPANQRKEQHFSYHIPLEKYINAYGGTLKCEQATRSREVLDAMYRWYVTDDNGSILSRLHSCAEKEFEKCSNNRKIPFFDPFSVPGLCDFCTLAGITTNQLTFDDTRYLCGGWFEEYLYVHAAKSGRECALSSKVSREGTTHNEFDVMMVENNCLYIIEAKTNFGGTTSLHNDALYKIKALEHFFGIRAHSIIATLDTDRIYRKAYKDRLKVMNAALLTREQLHPDVIDATLHDLNTLRSN
jgi:hypothetical protein